MSILFINPPLTRHDVFDVAPPLGLLTLASQARRLGLDAEVLDLNVVPKRLTDSWEDIWTLVECHLQALKPAVVAITSMGVNSHLAIQLANQIASQFHITVHLGGIHLSSIAANIKALLAPGVRIAPWGELTGASPSDLPWLVPLSKLGSDSHSGADGLFHSVNLEPYFSLNSFKVANFSLGAGCKYNCSFCYSPEAYGQSRQLLPAIAVEQLLRLQSYGFEHVFFIEDNLANSPAWLNGLARSIAECGKVRLTWNGYATLPDLQHLDFSLLAISGCRSLYVGVDATSPNKQKTYSKSFYRGPLQLTTAIEAAYKSGIVLTCAFILDFSDPTAIDHSLEVARVARDAGAAIRLAVELEYPHTALASRPSTTGPLVSDNSRPEILLDVPAPVIENCFAHENPELFPWHSRPSKVPNWRIQILAVAIAQISLNESPVGTIRKPERWPSYLHLAANLPNVEIHKTELKALLRSEILAHAPAIANNLEVDAGRHDYENPTY